MTRRNSVRNLYNLRDRYFSSDRQCKKRNTRLKIFILMLAAMIFVLSSCSENKEDTDEDTENAENTAYTYEACGSEEVRNPLKSPAITSAGSDEKGKIHIEWTRVDKADGYFVEFRRPDGVYCQENRVMIEGSWVCFNDITELRSKESYAVRVSSYIERDGEIKESRPCREVMVEMYKGDTDISDEEDEDEETDTDKPMIALTFDDGPLGGSSGERILDVLEKYGAKATFFMVGDNAAYYSENIKRKAELGMELGNHTWSHTKYGEDVDEEDIESTNNAIFAITGQYPTGFRSPGGMTTDNILEICREEDMPVYRWSVDTEDWKTRDADAVYEAVMDNVQDGDIVLMHEIYDSTADAVERIVPELTEQGYQLVTCHDLVTMRTNCEPQAGEEYFSVR